MASCTHTWIAQAVGKIELARELKDAGFEFDASKVLA
jgi:hypothetical protein